MPRVIAGKCGGIPLLAPKGEKTRPTTDKVKEALFSILTGSIPGCTFLDLFAGSGQMGLEAASRGASEVIMVDNNNSSREAISANLVKTGLGDSAEYLKGDVFNALRQLGAKGSQFDIIFMDPPYASAVQHTIKAGQLISSLHLLRPKGILVVEHGACDMMAEIVMNLTLYRRCKYGSTMLTFYTVDT